jgi:hypothetical protein
MADNSGNFTKTFQVVPKSPIHRKLLHLFNLLLNKYNKILYIEKKSLVCDTVGPVMAKCDKLSRRSFKALPLEKYQLWILKLPCSVCLS